MCLPSLMRWTTILPTGESGNEQEPWLKLMSLKHILRGQRARPGGFLDMGHDTLYAMLLTAALLHS